MSKLSYGARDGIYLSHNNRILSWAEDSVRLWEGDTGSSIAVMQHDRVPGIRGVRDAIYLPKINHILSWAGDTVRLWDGDTGALIAVMQHDNDVQGSIYLTHDNRILNWADDNTARLWSLPWMAIEGNVFDLACNLWPYDSVSKFNKKYGISTDDICVGRITTAGPANRIDIY